MRLGANHRIIPSATVNKTIRAVASKKNPCGNIIIRKSFLGSNIHKSLLKLIKWKYKKNQEILSKKDMKGLELKNLNYYFNV